MSEIPDALPLLPPVHLEMEWDGEQRFRGGRADEPHIVLDGRHRAGPGPVDTMVMTLIACSSIDVVEILAKRRTPARVLRVAADYRRVNGTPRRIKTIRLTYRVETDSDIDHVCRAVQLSLEKYCSVAGSLAPDIEIETDVEIIDPAAAHP